MRTLAVDVLYLLAVSIDEDKYQYLNGFNVFLREAGIVVDMTKKSGKESAK
jgi:hypothetical protein